MARKIAIAVPIHERRQRARPAALPASYHPEGGGNRPSKNYGGRGGRSHGLSRWVHCNARVFRTLCEINHNTVNETQAEKLKEHEAKRDFFCVVRDAFHIFARNSSMVLGSAWAFVLAL